MSQAPFLVFGIIFLVLAYFVGVKKQTWLLSGFNQRRVKDQDKLSKLVGSYNAIIGVAMLIASFIDHPDMQILFPIVIVGYVILLGYVNIKMVD
ncbi:DUF3784 domain-containing protein [Neobacillus dielmonensis]|uniref:DUF3784 domain-containing protein n=1 Tax=Neobacillus dielmonensis TaxID=1347369 RepID=UPI0005AAE35F|nr:DUF3784 domain-containing protein [Neobacillus dielmonensis]